MLLADVEHHEQSAASPTESPGLSVDRCKCGDCKLHPLPSAARRLWTIRDVAEHDHWWLFVDLVAPMI